MSVVADPTNNDPDEAIAGDVEVEDSVDAGPGAAEGTLIALEPLQAEVSALESDGAPGTAVPTAPVPPVVRVRRVSGRYRSAGAGFQLELRVDVDGVRPTRRVSGDFFQTLGATTRYFGSFIVHAPTVVRTPTHVKVEGTGKFTWSPRAPHVRITIPLASASPSSKPPATVQFITPSRTSGSSYLCLFASPYFRTVLWEQDWVKGTSAFVSYDTNSLPQPSSSKPRILTVSKAFLEAGIELLPSGSPSPIPISTAGSGATPTWSDSELHNAMVNHFSLFENAPQWRVWLLVATAHDDGYRGIMFDASDSFQRQGCAVFYDAIGGNSPATQRAQLRTYVHELGHAFNLLHSWQKNLADPPQPLGPNGGLGDLSWMNYAWKYQPPPPAPGGDAAYWMAFPFQFTSSELIHLRHGFYRDLIMGANPFGKGAAEIDPEMFDEPIVDNSGLSLDLRSKAAFALGEPVVVEVKLSTTDLRGRETHRYLHPKDGFVTIAIRQPSGRTVLYRPLMPRCADVDRSTRLEGEQPAIYESAFIGYGKDGFYFQQVGEYALRAEYVANDGSRVVSQVHRLRVRAPASGEDAEVAELLLGEDQGQLLYLLGSDSAALHAGNEAFDELLDRHAHHRLAVYGRLVKGINAQRGFKDVTPAKQLRVRPPDADQAIDHLTSVEEASAQDDGVDNITLNMVMRRHALAELHAGRVERANRLMDRMVEFFAAKSLNPNVLRTVKAQAEVTKAEIAVRTS